MTKEQLKAYRLSLNLTQAQFAQRVGLKRYRTIGDYENGFKPIPERLIKMIELEKKLAS